MSDRKDNRIRKPPEREAVVAYALEHPEEVELFLSNAPQSVPLEALLLVALGRRPIERMFEDGKTELGLDHFRPAAFARFRGTHAGDGPFGEESIP